MTSYTFDFDTTLASFWKNNKIRGLTCYLTKGHYMLRLGSYDEGDRYHLDVYIDYYDGSDGLYLLKYESDIEAKSGEIERVLYTPNDNFFDEEITPDLIYLSLINVEAYDDKNAKDLVDMAYELLTRLCQAKSFMLSRINLEKVQLDVQ